MSNVNKTCEQDSVDSAIHSVPYNRTDDNTVVKLHQIDLSIGTLCVDCALMDQQVQNFCSFIDVLT